MSAPPQILDGLLAQLEAVGVSLEELAAHRDKTNPAADTRAPGRTPTFAEYLDVVRTAAAATSPGAAKTYATYWRLAADLVGEVPLDRIRKTDLEVVCGAARERAKQNRPGTGGHSAVESMISALRAVFSRAVEDGLVERNVALGLRKPRRRPNRRRSLEDHEMEQLYEAAISGGDDPDLDALLLRFHWETGARRGGALALRNRDIDIARQTIWLLEKGDQQREQPISATLVAALVDHAVSRGATGADDQVLRYRPRGGTDVGAPLTRRRYNTLFGRLQDTLAWAREAGVSTHWLRHTAATNVERIAGFAVAQAFAGHGSADVTSTYVKASVGEVARAVRVLTGEPHPLANSG